MKQIGVCVCVCVCVCVLGVVAVFSQRLSSGSPVGEVGEVEPLVVLPLCCQVTH